VFFKECKTNEKEAKQLQVPSSRQALCFSDSKYRQAGNAATQGSAIWKYTSVKAQHRIGTTLSN
jgi:hypothetical protein